MTERGITFSDDMIRAILAGTKTQTRRVCRPQPDNWAWNGRPYLEVYQPRYRQVYCPYGAPGDRLYVKEAFLTDVPGCPNGISYRADHLDPHGDGPANPMRWKSGRFMPRWIARLFLEVTGVRVEQLQSITEADARAEGVMPDRLYSDAMRAMHGYSQYVCAFHDLWDRLNGKRRGYPWASSPWVWAITFSRLTP